MNSTIEDSTPGAPSTPVLRGVLASPAIRGSVWTIGGYAASQILRLGSNLILTRLLYPAVFGQMALVFIFISGLQMFSDVGTGPAIVQSHRGDDPDFLNTAWTIQCARGALLWIASCLIAWPIAAFYGQPELGWLIPAAGLTALIAGFEATSVHTLQRHLQLGRLTIADLLTQVIGMVGTLGLALLDRWWFGPDHPTAVWAIVGGSLISSAGRVALSRAYLPGIRNRFRLEREAVTKLFGFGRWIFVSTLLTFLAGQSDRLIFGKIFPMAFLGVYSIATMLAALPAQGIMKLGGAVVFPAYSRVVHRQDFHLFFWRVRWPLVLGGAAIVCGLFASGPFLIRVLYDRRYLEAGWILQYLAAAAWFQVLECTNGAALLAKGHVRWVAAGSAAKVVGMIAAIPIGFHLGGLEGALAGYVTAEFLKYLTSAAGAAAAGLHGFLRDTGVSVAVASLSASSFALGLYIARSTGSNLAACAVSATLAGGLWAGLGLWLFRRQRPDMDAASG